jgi:hypothetical protein
MAQEHSSSFLKFVLLLCSFDFRQIVELLNIIYCLAELLEFVAFLHLRIK